MWPDTGRQPSRWHRAPGLRSTMRRDVFRLQHAWPRTCLARKSPSTKEGYSYMSTAPSSAAALKRRARRKFRALPTIGAVALLAGLAWWGWLKTHPAKDPNANLLT